MQLRNKLQAHLDRAHHMQDQALRAPHRTVRRDCSAVQSGVQRRHGDGKPAPLEFREKGPAAGPVGNIGGLGQGNLPGASQVGFRARSGAAGLRTSARILERINSL